MTLIQPHSCKVAYRAVWTLCFTPSSQTKNPTIVHTSLNSGYRPIGLPLIACMPRWRSEIQRNAVITMRLVAGSSCGVCCRSRAVVCLAARSVESVGRGHARRRSAGPAAIASRRHSAARGNATPAAIIQSGAQPPAC